LYKVNASENVIVYMLYVCANPLVWLAIRLKLTPNIVTLVGLLFACAAMIIFNNQPTAYIAPCTLWLICVLIDHADGQVARRTNTVCNNAFELDHFTDLVKMSMIFLTISFNSSNLIISYLAVFCLTAMLWREVLAVELNKHNSIKKAREYTPKSPKKASAIRQNMINIFLTFNSHTTLFILVLFFDNIISRLFVGHFILLMLKDLFLYSIKLHNITVN